MNSHGLSAGAARAPGFAPVRSPDRRLATRLDAESRNWTTSSPMVSEDWFIQLSDGFKGVPPLCSCDLTLEVRLESTRCFRERSPSALGK